MSRCVQLARELVAKLKGISAVDPIHYAELAAWFENESNFATEDEVLRAIRLYGSDELEVDRPAVASRGDDGLWVQAWVWLKQEDT